MGNNQSNSEVEPQVGDIIRFPRKIPYDHFGVYAGNGDVIHRGVNGVDKDSLERVAGPRKNAEIANYLDKRQTPLPRNEIVDQARNRLGEPGYNISSKNCETFATWCRYGDSIGTAKGEGISEQVNRAAFVGTGITEDNPEYVLDQLPERGSKVAIRQAHSYAR